jgi:hypothetical protein
MVKLNDLNLNGLVLTSKQRTRQDYIYSKTKT